MELSERKIRILKAIVDDYIASGIPVGSRTISKLWGGEFSPATIRNEMSDLFEMGYLNPVSYTHLDVYKRQEMGRACPGLSNKV